MTQELTCIGCPLGCALTITDDLTVTGHQCNRGQKYAVEEVTNPTRNVTTSVFVTGGDYDMLSVKTLRPVPKDAVLACVRAIRAITVAAPVAEGAVVLANVADTGVDVVATRTVAHRLRSCGTQ